MPALSLRPCGPSAVLVEVADSAAARSLAAFARTARLEVDEIVPGARTVLFDGLRAGWDEADLAAALAQWTPEVASELGELVEVPVVLDGADVDAVAERWGEDVADVLGRTELVSAFCGFAPGFAYLGGLPERYAVPRLETPRARVPAGSVALAGSWCGIYPTASPGGWQLVGRTDVTLWDPTAERPALLAPGTRVRLVPCG